MDSSRQVKGARVALVVARSIEFHREISQRLVGSEALDLVQKLGNIYSRHQQSSRVLAYINDVLTSGAVLENPVPNSGQMLVHRLFGVATGISLDVQRDVSQPKQMHPPCPGVQYLLRARMAHQTTESQGLVPRSRLQVGQTGSLNTWWN